MAMVEGAPEKVRFDSFAQWIETVPVERVDRQEVRPVSGGSAAVIRVWNSRAFPDPATPDLSVQLLVNGTGRRGHVDVGAGRYAYAATPGTCSFAPAFVDCDYTGDDPFEMLVLAVPHERVVGALGEVSQTDFTGFGALHSRAWTDARVETLVHALWHTSGEPDSASSRLVAEGTTMAVLGELVRLDGTALPSVSDRSRLSAPTLARIEEYVQAHLHGPIGMDELAGIAGCTRYHFSRLFRQSTGQTPHQWVTRLRVERASVLLSTTELGVEAVAQRVGFSGRSGLTRAFRRHRGVAPGRGHRRG